MDPYWEALLENAPIVAIERPDAHWTRDFSLPAGISLSELEAAVEDFTTSAARTNADKFLQRCRLIESVKEAILVKGL